MWSLSPSIRWFAKLSIGLLCVKTVWTILHEYRWYFPPNFDQSAFLIGRRDSFHGMYAIAFYVHLFTGPTSFLLGAFLMFSGGQRSQAWWHRWSGRAQVILVCLVAVSGLGMALNAFAGPIAGLGFAVLALLTAATAVVAAYFAILGRMDRHRRWATRCFLLLCSPLLLRLFLGLMTVVQLDSIWSYRLIAWLSWLVPLAAHEAWRWWSSSNGLPPFRSSRLLLQGEIAS